MTLRFRRKMSGCLGGGTRARQTGSAHLHRGHTQTVKYRLQDNSYLALWQVPPIHRQDKQIVACDCVEYVLLPIICTEGIHRLSETGCKTPVLILWQVPSIHRQVKQAVKCVTVWNMCME